MQEQQLRRIDRFRSIHCRENDSLMAANLLEPAYLLEQTQVQIPPALKASTDAFFARNPVKSQFQPQGLRKRTLSSRASASLT